MNIFMNRKKFSKEGFPFSINEFYVFIGKYGNTLEIIGLYFLDIENIKKFFRKIIGKSVVFIEKTHIIVYKTPIANQLKLKFFKTMIQDMPMVMKWH